MYQPSHRALVSDRGNGRKARASGAFKFAHDDIGLLDSKCRTYSSDIRRLARKSNGRTVEEPTCTSGRRFSPLSQFSLEGAGENSFEFGGSLGSISNQFSHRLAVIQ